MTPTLEITLLPDGRKVYVVDPPPPGIGGEVCDISGRAGPANYLHALWQSSMKGGYGVDMHGVAFPYHAIGRVEVAVDGAQTDHASSPARWRDRVVTAGDIVDVVEQFSMYRRNGNSAEFSLRAAVAVIQRAHKL